MGKKNTTKPDNTYSEKDGVFTFTAWRLSVAAENIKDAKKHAREFHFVDVDTDIPPQVEPVKDLTEETEKTEA